MDCWFLMVNGFVLAGIGPAVVTHLARATSFVFSDDTGQAPEWEGLP